MGPSTLGRVAATGAYALTSTLRTIAESRFYGATQEIASGAIELVASQATNAAVPVAVAAAAIGVERDRKRQKISLIAYPAQTMKRSEIGSRYAGRAKSLRSYKKSIRRAPRIK